MIQDVDESLKELIRRDVVNGSNVEIAFDAPTTDWSSRRTGPAINLYLYDIQEDLDRRSVQYEEIRNERGVITERRMPPRKFRFSYLVTAWTQRPDDEHRLLGALLASFLRSDALPDEVLSGGLRDAGEPIRATIALPLPKDRQLSDIWSALGGELKPALNLVVTTPIDPKRLLPVGPIVTGGPTITFGDYERGFETVAPKSPSESRSDGGSEEAAVTGATGEDSSSDGDPAAVRERAASRRLAGLRIIQRDG
jgi:hypothetical protein